MALLAPMTFDIIHIDPWYGKEQQPNESAMVLMRDLIDHFASDRCVVRSNLSIHVKFYLFW